VFVILYIYSRICTKKLYVARETKHSIGDFETAAMWKDRSNKLECGVRTELGIVG